MTPSCRSRPIRSRSATTRRAASRSWSRAFSMAMPAWRANISTSRWSAALNSAAPRLSVRYRSPTGRPRTVTGTPSSECIGGWFGGKPDEFGVGGDVRDPVRAPLADDQAQQAVAARQGADRGPLLGGEADRDEPLDAAVARRRCPGRRSARRRGRATRSTISWSTVSRSRTSAIARVASSSASIVSTARVELRGRGSAMRDAERTRSRPAQDAPGRDRWPPHGGQRSLGRAHSRGHDAGMALATPPSATADVAEPISCRPAGDRPVRDVPPGGGRRRCAWRPGLGCPAHRRQRHRSRAPCACRAAVTERASTRSAASASTVAQQLVAAGQGPRHPDRVPRLGRRRRARPSSTPPRPSRRTSSCSGTHGRHRPRPLDLRERLRPRRPPRALPGGRRPRSRPDRREPGRRPAPDARRCPTSCRRRPGRAPRGRGAAPRPSVAGWLARSSATLTSQPIVARTASRSRPGGASRGASRRSRRSGRCRGRSRRPSGRAPASRPRGGCAPPARRHRGCRATSGSRCARRSERALWRMITNTWRALMAISHAPPLPGQPRRRVRRSRR